MKNCFVLLLCFFPFYLFAQNDSIPVKDSLEKESVVVYPVPKKDTLDFQINADLQKSPYAIAHNQLPLGTNVIIYDLPKKKRQHVYVGRRIPKNKETILEISPRILKGLTTYDSIPIDTVILEYWEKDTSNYSALKQCQELFILAVQEGKNSDFALQYAWEAIERMPRQEKGTLDIEIDVWQYIININERQKKIPKQEHQALLALLRQKGDKLLLTQNLKRIGEFYENKKLLTDAEDLFLESLEIRNQLANQDEIARNRLYLQDFYVRHGEIKKAEEQVLELVTLHKKQGDYQKYKAALENAEEFYIFEKPDYEQVVYYISWVYEWNVKKKPTLAFSGLTASIQKRMEQIIATAEEKEKISTFMKTMEAWTDFETDSLVKAHLYEATSLAYELNGDYFPAAQNLGKAIICDSTYYTAEALNYTGDLLQKAERYELALTYFEEVFENYKDVDDVQGVIHQYFKIGYLYQFWEDKPDKALSYYHKTLKTVEKEGVFKDDYVSEWKRVIDYLLNIKERKEALKFCEDIVKTLENIPNASLMTLKDFQNLYADLEER